MAADPIITLNEYKVLMGVDPTDDRNDGQIRALLPAASKAVRTYTGRPFEVAGSVATERSFQYDGSGFLDIDDAVEVTSLSTDTGIPGQSYSLNYNEWTQMPQDDSEVYHYLLIHGGPFLGGSPEMGFERNLDTIGMSAKSPLITVTALWGWTEIPDDVRLATALTAQNFAGAAGTTEGLTAESIEGWSRSWGSRQGGSGMGLAVPNRARDLLVGYQRVFV